MTYDPFEHAPPVESRHASTPVVGRPKTSFSPGRTPGLKERTGYPDVVLGLAALAAAGAALAGTRATGLAHARLTRAGGLVMIAMAAGALASA